jgi:predicted metal-dependent hydrolase
MDESERDEKFQRGFEQFNAREFFAAHETWEEIWLAAPEPDKTFLQGIIQVAAAFHHYRRGNTAGTQSLLAAGLQKLSRFPADHRGLQLEALCRDARCWLKVLASGKDPGESALPKIEQTPKCGPPPTGGPHLRR